MDMQQLTISNVWVEECFSPCGRTNTFYIPRPQTAFAILKSGSGEYKNKAAISFAEELLIQKPQMTIDEISEASGFESSIYFRRVFKSVTGMSPANYRKNERGDL